MLYQRVTRRFFFKALCPLIAGLCLALLVLMTAVMAAVPTAGAETGSAVTRPLRVAYDPELPPFTFLEDGAPKGFAVDLLEAIAKEEGYDLTWRPLNRRQSIEALDEQKIDVILGINFMADLDEDMAFSEPYFHSSIALIVPKSQQTIQSITDLSEKVVAVQADTLEFDFLKNIRRVRPHLTSTQVDALQLLAIERAQAYVGNRTVAEYLLNRSPWTGKYRLVESYFLPLEMAMGVHQDNYILLQSLNRGLRLTQMDGTYQQLYNRWFDDTQVALSRRIHQLINMLIGLSMMSILILVGGLYWNRLLQKEVNKKTWELRMNYIGTAWEIEVSLRELVHRDRLAVARVSGGIDDGQVLSPRPRFADAVGGVAAFDQHCRAQFWLVLAPLAQRHCQSTVDRPGHDRCAAEAVVFGNGRRHRLVECVSAVYDFVHRHQSVQHRSVA